MKKQTKVVAAITIVLIAAGSVLFLSGTDLMGRMKLSQNRGTTIQTTELPKAYDEGRYQNYKKAVETSTCQDKIDNDNDGFIDYGEDPDCKYLWDDEDEYNAPSTTPAPVESTPISLECNETKELIYSTQNNIHTFDELVDFINEYKSTGQNCFLTFKSQFAQSVVNYEDENEAKFLVTTQEITKNNASNIGKQGLTKFTGWITKTNKFDLTYSNLGFETYNFIVDLVLSPNYSVYRAQAGVLNLSQPVTSSTQLSGSEIPIECPVTPERFYSNDGDVDFETLRGYLYDTQSQNQPCELLMVRDGGVGTIEFSLKLGTNLLGVNGNNMSFEIDEENGIEIQGGSNPVVTGTFEAEKSSPNGGGVLNMATDKFEVYRSSNFWN